MNAIKKLIGTGLLVTIVAIGITACSEDEYSSRLNELIIKNVELSSAAETKTQTFRSEDLSNYEASSDQDWCVATIDEKGLTVTATANNTYEARTATVTVKDKKDETMSRTFMVTQAQKDAVVVGQNTYEVPGEGGKVTVTVQHNVDFTVLSDAGWITEEPASSTRALDSSDIILNVEKNNSGGERLATIQLINGATGEATVVSIKQAFTPEFSVDLESLSIDERGGTLQIQVKANFALDISYGDSWLSDGGIEKIDDLSFYLTVNVEPYNEKKASRTSTVIFSNSPFEFQKEVQVVQTRSLYIAQDTYEVPGDGGKVNITVQHSVDFTVIPDSSWISVEPASKSRAMESSDIVLNVEKNNSGGERSGTVKVVNSVSGEVTAITIKQGFNPEFSVNTESLSINELGGTLQILVKSNFELNISFGDSWLSDGGVEKVDDVIFWQKVNVKPFTEKMASRTSTVTFSNLAQGIYKDVQIVQTRSLYIQAVSVTLNVGDTYDLPLSNEGKAAVLWMSSNEEVATVNMDGKITAINPGTATITVKSADGVYSDKVTVTVM